MYIFSSQKHSSQLTATHCELVVNFPLRTRTCTLLELLTLYYCYFIRTLLLYYWSCTAFGLSYKCWNLTYGEHGIVYCCAWRHWSHVGLPYCCETQQLPCKVATRGVKREGGGQDAAALHYCCAIAFLEVSEFYQLPHGAITSQYVCMHVFMYLCLTCMCYVYVCIYIYECLCIYICIYCICRHYICTYTCILYICMHTRTRANRENFVVLIANLRRRWQRRGNSTWVRAHYEVQFNSSCKKNKIWNHIYCNGVFLNNEDMPVTEKQ
jgi:hypothetical protein